MDNNFRNWVLLFRCFCALVMCASFFTIMIPAAIVQNYFVGTTCGAIIRQSNEQVSEGIVPPQQIIHPANVTSQDESDYVTVALFAFIAGGMVLATVLQATDTQHAIVTALFAGGYFVLSTIQISLKLRPAREARPLDPSTITQIFDAPVMEGPFCQTFVLQDSEGINAETWTCSLASVLQGDVRQSEQRACNSSVSGLVQ